MGRPSALTDERQAKLVELLEAGVHVEVACKRAGISKQTFYNWIDRGRDDGPDKDEPYREFRAIIEKARATAEARAVTSIQVAASKGSWQAAAWFLERAFPERWGKTAQRTSDPDEGAQSPAQGDSKGLRLVTAADPHGGY